MEPTAASERGVTSRASRFALAVIVLNVVLLGFLYWQRLERQAAPPAYGQSMPGWLAESHSAAFDPGATAEGSEGASRPPWRLVLYSHRAPPEPLARYLSVLMHRFRDQGAGLRVDLVLGAEHLGEAGSSSFNHDGYRVVVDSDGEIRKRLDLPPHADWTFLVAPDNHLAFSASGLIGRDELRQHLEKHLLGRIRYARSPETAAGASSRLPPYAVIDARGQRGHEPEEPFQPPPGTMVIVLPASLCATCNPAEIYDSIASFHQARCAEGVEGCRIQILATAGYPIEDLLWQLEVRGLSELAVYRATGKLDGLEDEYFTKRSGGEDAWVLTVGKDREVLALATLGHFMEAEDET